MFQYRNASFLLFSSSSKNKAGLIRFKAELTFLIIFFLKKLLKHDNYCYHLTFSV